MAQTDIQLCTLNGGNQPKADFYQSSANEVAARGSIRTAAWFPLGLIAGFGQNPNEIGQPEGWPKY